MQTVTKVCRGNAQAPHSPSPLCLFVCWCHWATVTSLPWMQIAETYAFLPREAVTRFLMSCGECQKRMHINPSTAEFKGQSTTWTDTTLTTYVKLSLPYILGHSQHMHSQDRRKITEGDYHVMTCFIHEQHNYSL